MATPGTPGMSAGQLLGWAIGPVFGTVPLVFAQYFFILSPRTFSAPETFFITLVFTVGGAFIGGALGYILSYLLDDPPFGGPSLGSVLLFSIVFSVLIFALLTFPLIPYVSQEITKSNLQYPRDVGAIYAIAAFIAGFVPAGANGVINNFIYGRGVGNPPTGRSMRPFD